MRHFVKLSNCSENPDRLFLLSTIRKFICYYNIYFVYESFFSCPLEQNLTLNQIWSAFILLPFNYAYYALNYLFIHLFLTANDPSDCPLSELEDINILMWGFLSPDCLVWFVCFFV